MSFEFDGFAELEKELDKLENLSDDIQKASLEAGGEVLEHEYKTNIYKRIDRDSGEAQKSIYRTRVNKKGETHVGPSTDAYYLTFLENGFYNVRAKKFIPATPIFVPIFLQSREKVLRAMIEQARKELNKI